MKPTRIRSQPCMACVIGMITYLFIAPAHAERLLDESFENINSSNDPVGWGTAGHPSYLRVANESDSSWTTPYGEHAMLTYSSGVGTKPVGFVPNEFEYGPNGVNGVYTAKFHISSEAAIGEYRAELWAIPHFGVPTLLAYTEGDTNGSKDFSFTDEITWRYEYNDWLSGAYSTIDGAELQLRLMQDPNRTNWRHTPAWDNVTVDYVPDIDTQAPTVEDFSNDNEGVTVLATNSVVTYTVTFTEAMNPATVDVSDFVNAASSDVIILSVTPSSGDTAFLVEVMPTSVGTLRLGIQDGAELEDVAGNPMNTTATSIQDVVTFNVEAGTPTILPSDFVDDQGGGTIEEDTLVTYTLTFSKDMDVATVSAADFGNAGSAPITIGTITETNPGVFTVQVTPTGSGTLRFRIKAGVDIRAADGGTLNTGSAIADDTTIIVDSEPPTLTDFQNDTQGSPVAVGTLVTYEVFFSEAMDTATVDASDFGNALTTGNAPFIIDSVAEASPGVFRIEITPTGAGSIRLQVNVGATLDDVAGNALNTTLAILDDTTITVEGPTADPYDDWADGSAFSDDTNGDGVANALAWVLGADDPHVAANVLLPSLDTQSDPDFVVFTFRRKDEANDDPNHVITVQYGTSLDSAGWSDAMHDGTDIIITETDNFYSASPGIDKVEVSLRKSAFALDDRLFLRLGVAPAQ